MREMNYWNNKENCIKESKKYSSISELQKSCYGCYMGLRRNGWLDEIFPNKDVRKAIGYWDDLNNCIEECKKQTQKSCRELLIYF